MDALKKFFRTCAASTENARIIMKKELKSYFVSPIAYIVITLFLLFTGILFFSTFFLYDRAELRGFFQILPLTFAIFIPAVTMKLFAEEKNTGSFEMLMTLPVSTADAVAGKILAATAFAAVMLLPTIVYPVSVFIVGSPDIGPIIGGYCGALLLGAAYASIGVFASSLTKNQITAFIISFAACMALWAIDIFLPLLPAGVVDIFEYISVNSHFNSIAKGVIDTRDVIYFASLIALCAMGTGKSIEERR
ncbi:MAG: ABC transporter permease [Spirochaetota bacterium]